jgi:hypothetical protein
MSHYILAMFFVAFLDPRLVHKDIVNNDEVERVREALNRFTIDISARSNAHLVQHPPPINNDQANMPVVRPPNLERAMEFYNSSDDESSVIAQEIALFRTSG